MEPLSASARKFQDILHRLDSNFNVVEFNESTRTAQDAADRLGCKLGQIVKSMVFKGLTSNVAILVLTSGTNRVDEKKMSLYVNESIARADPDFVRSKTGYAIGGVPPVGHTLPVETFIDEDLLQYTTVWAAAGTPNAVFELQSSELSHITHGKIVRVRPD